MISTLNNQDLCPFHSPLHHRVPHVLTEVRISAVKLVPAQAYFVIFATEGSSAGGLACWDGVELDCKVFRAVAGVVTMRRADALGFWWGKGSC